MTRDELVDLIRKSAVESYKDIQQTFEPVEDFPSLKGSLTDLMTDKYFLFIDEISWVSPRPATFRIDLKNGNSFMMIWKKRSWVAKIAGKSYYLLNLPEEERAAQAIGRLLQYALFKNLL